MTCPCKGRQLGTAYVLEYQLCFDVRDFFARSESRHREIPQMIGVAGPYVYQEIDRAGDVVQLHDLGQTERMLSEGVDIRLEMAYQPDRDHRLNANPEARRRYIGMETADDAACLQQAYAHQAGRGGQADLPGNLLV